MAGHGRGTVRAMEGAGTDFSSALGEFLMNFSGMVATIETGLVTGVAHHALGPKGWSQDQTDLLHILVGESEARSLLSRFRAYVAHTSRARMEDADWSSCRSVFNASESLMTERNRLSHDWVWGSGLAGGRSRRRIHGGGVEDESVSLSAADLTDLAAEARAVAGRLAEIGRATVMEGPWVLDGRGPDVVALGDVFRSYGVPGAARNPS